MLNFDNSFFKPEIKNGFFIDSTMKSMWAAILETLAHISVVCDKHGIQWYAAYGTLLGAIRHEGFIPWDDDIDIWVMREDYNKLIGLLSEELPPEYVVRSPLNNIGYDQFQSCINNGSTVTMNADRLKEYHGCPFTVAIDVFPLDYLPRNENDRFAQSQFFSLAANGARIASEIKNNDFTDENYSSKYEELMIAKETLEASLGYRFNEQNFIDNKFDMIPSDFWKCANCIAMMFDESNCDHIVEYVDYSRSGLKFSKDFFSAGYAATFENLMFPIPSGYDHILKSIYGNYMNPIKNPGAHEYPFYARQLREVRSILRQMEQNRPEPANIQPGNWRELIKDKKVLLFEDGIPIYTEFGKKALDKLKENLELFKENSDKVVPWWRPQSQIRTALSLMDSEMLSEYNNIVDQYLNDGYGIYDTETDDDIALEKCDAYYGEQNSTVNLLKGKVPVMIEAII